MTRWPWAHGLSQMKQTSGECSTRQPWHPAEKSEDEASTLSKSATAEHADHLKGGAPAPRGQSQNMAELAPERLFDALGATPNAELASASSSEWSKGQLQ